MVLKCPQALLLTVHLTNPLVWNGCVKVNARTLLVLATTGTVLRVLIMPKATVLEGAHADSCMPTALVPERLPELHLEPRAVENVLNPNLRKALKQTLQRVRNLWLLHCALI